MPTVELTDDECSVLRAILYGAVGGPVSGSQGEPRRIVNAIAGKVPWLDRRKYRAEITTVNRRGRVAVVVSEVVPTKGE